MNNDEFFSVNNTTKISREELMAYVREELICTIGSADSPVTIPVLITTFREDTCNDIGVLAEKLGYPSIPAMLGSDDFRDVIEPCYTDMAKGAGNVNPEKIKSRPDIAHILSSIEDSNRFRSAKETEKFKRLQVLVRDPKSCPKILMGKENLLKCLHNLGAEEKEVELQELQKEYKVAYGVEMNKSELKRFFPTGKLKTIIDTYLYDDIEIFTDNNRTGSLLFKMKRTMEEVNAESDKILKERLEAIKMEEEATKLKFKNKFKSGKPKNTQPVQPRKLRVIKPPPEPKIKPKPVVKPLVTRSSIFYTDDALLAKNINHVHNLHNSNSNDENSSDNEEMNEVADEELNKKRYTSAVEGAEFTDSENDDTDEETEEFRLVDFNKDFCSTSDASVPSSNESKKENGVKNEIDFDELKKLSEQRNNMRFAIAAQSMKKRREFFQQFENRNQTNAPMEGTFAETTRFGRRAKEEEQRRERVQQLLDRMDSNNENPLKPKLVVADKSEEKKFLIAAVIAQFVLANRELGLSEAKNMLKLLFAEHYSDVEIEMPSFIEQYLPCMKLVRAPIEPHIVIEPECAKAIIKAFATRIGNFNNRNLKRL
uniref:Troponin T n=1 Tax=Meloidogyne hapla TaxID=6305 RepID=A0A1I8BB12_MELHA